MFQNFMTKLANHIRRFMMGRYGTDKLNMTILGTSLAVCVLSLFFRTPGMNLFLTAVSFGLMFWAIARSFSRNTYQRYQENRKFMQFFDRLKDREHRYFDCPKCRQVVRVPRGKGKIAITCPRCREKFIKKT